MKTITSYKIIRGQDGSQCKVINWSEDAFYLGFVEGQVRFYSEYGPVHSHYKVYIPQQGEPLEITGEATEWNDAEYDYYRKQLLSNI